MTCLKFSDDLKVSEEDITKRERRARETVMVKQAQKEGQSAHRTQWTAQFAVASELRNRGYQVALTMGIHPVIDLMVVSPKGISFLVDVKGQYQKNIWTVRLNKARGKLFYVLAFVSDVDQTRFFILTKEEVEREIRRDLQHAVARREAGLDGEPLSVRSVTWDFAKKHESAWKVLPE